MNLSKAVEMIKRWEGCKVEAYQDGEGIWTIGYGTTRYANGNRVKKGDTINQHEAEAMMIIHLDNESQRVIDLCHPVTMTENEHNALCSFVYNVGSTQFKDSEMLRLIHEPTMTFGYNKALVSDQFLRWKYDNHKEVPGLLARRKEERELFLED